MNRVTLSLVILIQLFAFSCFAQIQGGVFDQNKQGLANVTIIASDSLKTRIDTVRSDERGFYAFRNLPPDNYRVEARAPGFQNAIFENIKARQQKPADGIVRRDIRNVTRLEIYLKPDTSNKKNTAK